MFTARLCSLLTLSNETAVPSTWVHAAQEELCVFGDLGSHHSPVLSQVLDTDPPPPFASCHMMRLSNQNLCRIACEKS